jgi:hypothetical protein
VLEDITLNDYITKTTKMQRSDVTNFVTVPYVTYEIVDGVPKEIEEQQGSWSESDGDSILEFGKIAFEYNSNHLIQTAPHAANIGSRILSAFKNTPHTSDIQMFGDVTRKLGDLLLIPDYQKHEVDTRSLYTVTRISTDYDGGIRQNVTCRMVQDVVIYNQIIDELCETPEYHIKEIQGGTKIIDELR